jgi:hypothetical protein
MTIVTAGVHLAIDLRSMGKGVFLPDRKSVHVGAETNGGAPLAAPKNTNHPGAADFFMDYHTEAPQQFSHSCGGPVLREPELWMTVKIVAPPNHLIL